MNLNSVFRAFRANARLGWDLEGNWAPPVVYVLFALIPPVSSVLMLVFMYLVVMGGGGDKSFLAFLLTGAAAFMFVRLLLAGAGMVVVEDREHYRMFRYIYSSPVPFPAQVFGRVAPKIIIALVGAALTFAAGAWMLNVPLRPDGVDWAVMIGSLVVAIVGMGAVGWMLASFMLLIDRMGWMLAEGIAGLLFLITGAVIPLSLLPAPVAAIGKALPITYWMDLWRLAVYGTGSRLARPELTQVQLWVGLTITTVVWAVLAVIWHNLADRLARKWGKIEQETFY